jgi:hypothetical protein
VPFASAHALYGSSKLSVWWLRLGIQLERITPGHPEQNGRHERMHLTLKTEATKPAAANVLQQQGRFDTFIRRFNQERPHQALDMKTPSALYAPSTRPYCGLEELDYPVHDWTAVITTCGRICYQARKINVSQVFAGQKVGVKQMGEHVWLVSFMQDDLGDFDDETIRVEPIENPFGPKCYLCSGINRHPCDRNRPKENGSPYWTISATLLLIHGAVQMFGSRSKYSSSSFLPPSPSPICFSDSMNSIRSIHLTILYPSWFSTRSRRGAP